MSSKSNQMSATALVAVPSGKCLWAEGLVWLIGAVVCLLAAARVQCSLAWAVDRPHSTAAPLSLSNQLPLRDCKAHCSGSAV